MRTKNKSKQKKNLAFNSAKRSNKKVVAPEKASARDETKTTVMEVIKVQDNKKNDKPKVSPAEQNVKLNVRKNARKKRIPVELQSSDDIIDIESLPTISPNSKVYSQVVLPKSGEESYDDYDNAHDEGNDVSTAKGATAPNEKPEPLVATSSSESESDCTRECEPRSDVECSSEDESTSEDVSSNDEEDGAPYKHCKNFFSVEVYRKTDERELSSEGESTSENVSSSDEEDGVPYGHNKIFVPVKVYTKTDKHECDSNEDKEVVPVSEKASNNKVEFKKYESEEEPKLLEAQPPVVSNEKKTEFEKDKCEDQKTLKAYSPVGNNKKTEGQDKEEQIREAKPISNTEKGCAERNNANNDEIPCHMNDLTGKEKSHISRVCSHENEETAVPSEKPTSKMEVNNSSKKYADKGDEISVKANKGSKRLIDLVLDNGGSKRKKFKKEINCFRCNQPGHILKDCTKKSGGFSDMMCFKCDEIGHMSSECPKQKSLEGGKRCFECSKIGHKSKECPNRKSFEGGRKCYNCDEVGHMFKECPKQNSFEGGKTCYICNGISHMSRECPQQKSFKSGTRCYNCYEIGHMSRECPKQKSFEGGTRCFKCSKIGHISRECPQQKSFKVGEIGHMFRECSQQGSFQGGSRCYNCYDIGHMSRECPKQEFFEGGTRCFNCSKIGHMSKECPQQKSFEGGTKCYNCNEIGHMSRECPQLKSFEVGENCYNCNEIGHMSRECPQLKSFEGGTRCYNCNEIGHMSRECRNQKSFKSGTGCYNCNEIGHMARECPKRKSDGSGMSVSNYIMRMSRECPSKYNVQVANNRTEVDYSSIEYHKVNDVECFDFQKTINSWKDCADNRNSSYMKLTLSDQTIGKGKHYASADYPQEEEEAASIIPSVKHTFRGGRLESQYDNDFGFKVKKGAKRFYDSIFNDSGPSEKKYRTEVNCFICNQPGHTNNDCPTKNFGGGSEMLCVNCNEVGHMSRECPMKKSSLASHVCCNCDETGLMPRGYQTKKFRGNVMKCHNCNGIGHTHVECPSKVGVRGDDLRRYITDNKCDEVGHYHLKNMKSFDRREHSKTDCHDEPMKNIYHQNGIFKHVDCFNCKEMVHISRDCPKRNDSVGGAGFGRGGGADGYGKGRHCC